MWQALLGFFGELKQIDHLIRTCRKPGQFVRGTSSTNILEELVWLMILNVATFPAFPVLHPSTQGTVHIHHPTFVVDECWRPLGFVEAYDSPL